MQESLLGQEARKKADGHPRLSQQEGAARGKGRKMTITKTEAPQFLDFLRGPSPQELSERIGLLQEVVFREAKQPA